MSGIKGKSGVYKRTNIHKKALRVARRGSGVYRHKKGYNLSEKTREKMSLFWKEKPNNVLGKHWKLTPKQRRNLSKAKKGIKPKNWKTLFTPEINQKRSQSLKGSKSYLWKGGISFEPYSIDWTETLRRAIRERDKYICQICNSYGNMVHHIDYDKRNCNPNNLVTLCRKCHIRTNHNRENWKENLESKIK